MRETQWIGLSPRARDFLSEQDVVCNEVTVRSWPDGRLEVTEPRKVLVSRIKKEQWGHTYGMFDEEIPLHKYTFPDGRVLFEVVLAEPWSSGPCIFTTLRATARADQAQPIIHNGVSLDWTDEEIQSVL